MPIHLNGFDVSAKTSLAPSWGGSWDRLLLGASEFCSGQERFGNWPDSVPIACVDPSVLPDELHARAPRLARILGAEAKAILRQLQRDNPGIRVGVIVASSHGDSHAASETSEALVSGSPIGQDTATSIVQDTLYPSFVAGIEQHLPGMAISAACASAGIGLGMAAARVRGGALDACFLVSLDVQSRIAHAGFRQIGAMAAAGCKPFDKDRDGTTIGEAGAFLLVTAEDVIVSSGPRFRVEMAGFGQSCDARHSVEPSVDGLQAAIARALASAGKSPTDIAAVYWHGTGTIQNDRTEAEVASRLWGDAPPPGTSVKGAFGHTMGASAALSFLGAGETLSTGKLPPTAGLKVPAFDALNIASGAPVDVSDGPILIVSLGFGGINSAVVLDHAEP